MTEPAAGGWFVVNARDAEWIHHAKFGPAVMFEGPARFAHLGMNIQVVGPGQPNGYYHAEDAQEDFLILSGECLLLIEGEERRLRAWDLVHCPPGTEHIFVGAGDGPCAILAVGARNVEGGIFYPRSELALRHGAGASEPTDDPQTAYAGILETTRGPYSGGLPDRE